MMQCRTCMAKAVRLFDGQCNRCLCREAIDEAMTEELESAEDMDICSVNSPLTPLDYIDVVHGDEQLDWKSYLQ